MRKAIAGAYLLTHLIDLRCLIKPVMRDLTARYEKLLADAADCEVVANLGNDVRKRAQFARLAEQYKGMAAALRIEIESRKSQSTPS